jgi:hypothetical protein
MKIFRILWAIWFALLIAGLVLNLILIAAKFA